MKHTKGLTVFILLLICIQGCGLRSSNKDTTTENRFGDAEIETVDPSPIDGIEIPGYKNNYKYQVADSIDADLTDVEKLLCIDLDKRKDMIEKFGADTYWIGVNVAAIIWQSQTNNSSPIKEDSLKGYDSKYKIETIELTSSLDGHEIPADYFIQNNEKNNDTVIIIHGASENRRNPMSVINEFLDRGLNVITYDQRSSGDNTARLCTYGEYEQYDLQQYVDYVDNIIDDNHKIYVYARSQAGCTAGRVLGTPNGNDKIDGAILDCPLGSYRKICEKNMSDLGLGDKMNEYMEASDQITKYLFGFTIDDCEIAQYIKKTTVPTLVLTSNIDSIVDKGMPIALYDAIKDAKKKLYVSEKAAHCCIGSFDVEEYEKLLDQFVDGSLFN